MQLVAYAALLWLVLVSLVLPNLFIPFVLSGLIDASVPSNTMLTAWTGLVLALALSLITFNLLRLRRRATALLGGALVIASLVYFGVSSSILGSDSAYSIRSLQLWVGDTTLVIISIVVWRLACSTLNPGVHMLHYMTTAAMLSSLACRLLDLIERTRPLHFLLGPVRADPSSEWFRVVNWYKIRMTCAVCAARRTSPFSRGRLLAPSPVHGSQRGVSSWPDRVTQ
ncbi:hypothetical protein T492DRAFT_233500 [Pavlovales sp. CCMP2436]|nr:hypothetical protein T492DRAFT_233500 [Pavlovales sp. CCMP2436]